MALLLVWIGFGTGLLRATHPRSLLYPSVNLLSAEPTVGGINLLVQAYCLFIKLHKGENVVGALSDYIRNLAMFLIFSSFISIISPGKKYEQYINLVLGIILIFILTAPLAGVVNALSNSSGDIFADINLAYDRAALARQISYADAANQDLILSIYKEGLTEQTRRLVENHGEFYLEEAFFEIDVDENFGDILSIHLILSEVGVSQRFLRIDPVRITPVIGGRGERQAEAAESDVENPHILSLKNLLSSFYNLDKRNIILEARD